MAEHRRRAVPWQGHNTQGVARVWAWAHRRLGACLPRPPLALLALLALPTGALAGVSLGSGASTFGHVNMGSAGPTQTYSLTVAASTVTSLSAYVGGATGKDFTVSGGSCTNGSTADCTVDVSFTPTAPGLRTGVLEVGYNDGSAKTLSIPLQGFADAPIAALGDAAGSVVTTSACALSSAFQTAEDGNGNLYVSAYSGNRVCKFPAGGGAGVQVSFPGVTLSSVTGVAIDSRGNLYVADYGNSRLVRLNTNGTTQVLTPSTSLSLPTTLSFGANGDLYVDDYGNGRIVVITATSLASGSSAVTGMVISTGSFPLGSVSATGTAVDSQGYVYVANYANNRILKVPPGGGAGTTVLSMGGFTLSNPYGVAVDAMDNVYVMDSGSRSILQVDRSGNVSQIKVSGITFGSYVYSMYVRPSGEILVSDFANNRLVSVNRQQGNLSLGSVTVGTTSAAQTSSLFNLGNASLSFAIPATGNNPALAAGDFALAGAATTCPITASGAGSVATLVANSSCTVGLTFTPSAAGARSSSLVFTDNHQYVGGQTQQLNLSGTGLVDTIPNAFSFTPQTGVALSTTITSNTITVSGINAPSPISVTGGSYAINGGAYTTTAGTVNNGDTVTLRHTASGSYATTTSTVLTIGGVQGTFTSQTLTQASVTSLPTTASGVTASLSVTGCTAITNGASFAAPPAGAAIRFPYGLLSFVATGCTGSTATVTVTYSQALPAGASFYKCQGATCNSYPATLTSNTVTYTITDNGAGDEDAIVGQITDPNGVGLAGEPTAVPSLDAWGRLLLVLLLGSLGAVGAVGVPGKGGRRPRAN